MRFLIGLLVLVAVGGVVSACGEDETAVYRSAFLPVSGEIVATGRGVERAIAGAGAMKNEAEVAVAFARLSDDASRIAGSLVRISAPKEFAADHRGLISGLRREAGHLNRISRAAIDGDAGAGKRATGQATLGAGEIRDPRQRILTRLGVEPG